jgi:hypothetical protein
MAQESIEATIGQVTFDNGWYRIETDQGEFSTKFQDRGSEAQQFVGQRVLIAYEPGNNGQPRQDKNGKWWPAPRYVSGISSPGYVQPQLTPQQGAPMPNQPQGNYQPQPQPVQLPPPRGEDENTRNTRIMRQTAGKLAVWTLPLVPSEQRTFENQLAIAEAWMRYFIGGAAGTGLSPGVVAEQVVEQVAGQLAPDGIPF